MSTISKEFTKEQLIEQAKKNIEVLRGAVEKIPGSSDAAVIHLKLAEITLASLEAEPVAWLYSASFERGHVEGELTDAPGCDMPVYTSPPAPVSVPTFDEWLEIRGNKPLGWVKDAMRESYDACRAAMLQGADGNSPVIPDGWVLVPVEPTPEMQTASAGAIRFDTTPINKLWTGNAVYKAMIAAAPQQEVKP